MLRDKLRYVLAVLIVGSVAVGFGADGTDSDAGTQPYADDPTTPTAQVDVVPGASVQYRVLALYATSIPGDEPEGAKVVSTEELETALSGMGVDVPISSGLLPARVQVAGEERVFAPSTTDSLSTKKGRRLGYTLDWRGSSDGGSLAVSVSPYVLDSIGNPQPLQRQELSVGQPLVLGVTAPEGAAMAVLAIKRTSK